MLYLYNRNGVWYITPFLMIMSDLWGYTGTAGLFNGQLAVPNCPLLQSTYTRSAVALLYKTGGIGDRDTDSMT